MEKPHLSETLLLSHARGSRRLAPEEINHLHDCTDCQKYLAWLVAGLDAVREEGIDPGGRQVNTSATASAKTLDPPADPDILSSEPASRELVEDLLSQWMLGEPLEPRDEVRVSQWLESPQGLDLAQNLGIELRLMGAALASERLSARGIVIPPLDAIVDAQTLATLVPEAAPAGIDFERSTPTLRAPSSRKPVTELPLSKSARGTPSEGSWRAFMATLVTSLRTSLRSRPALRASLGGGIVLAAVLLIVFISPLGFQQEPALPGGYNARGEDPAPRVLTLEGTLYQRGADGLWEVVETLKSGLSLTEPTSVSCRPGMALLLRVFGQGSGTLSLWQQSPEGEVKQLYLRSDVRMNATFETLQLRAASPTGHFPPEDTSDDVSPALEGWNVPTQAGRWEILAVLSQEPPARLWQKNWVQKVLTKPETTRAFSRIACDVKQQ